MQILNVSYQLLNCYAYCILGDMFFNYVFYALQLGRGNRGDYPNQVH